MYSVLKDSMKKTLAPVMLLVALSGCTSYSLTPVATAPTCTVEPAYEVTVDSWCGNGCDSYPVSHRMRDIRPENRRVALNGTQRATPCVSQ